MNKAVVVGAGLAGAEAAWQLARRGVSVTLYDMKPGKKSPAHSMDGFAELVCSNSLRSNRLQNAVGLLKEEMRLMDSLIMRAADATSVPAGGALAVDRTQFSDYVTKALNEHPHVTVANEEVTDFPALPHIIATGPLTEGKLFDAIVQKTGEAGLNFYDAAAPIVHKDSLDMTAVFQQSRYNRGEDYLNCPMTEREYHAFIDALLTAEVADIQGFEDKKVFEGCMPIEVMARRGRMVPAFGPLKPVGLTDPRTGKMPFAVLQLRQDDAGDSLYNLVGFQTRLKFPEQKRVFGLIPGLQDAVYARYGVMHRNTFLDAPKLLDASFRLKGSEHTYFAGQITGVEGYVESAATGLMAGVQLYKRLQGQDAVVFPFTTAHGALCRHVSTMNRSYQPMNVTFGLIDELDERIWSKEARYLAVAERALEAVKTLVPQLD